MKKLFLSAITILFVVNIFAQSDSRRPTSLGLSFFVNDFTTAAQIKKYGIANVFKNKDAFRSSRFNAGVAINYLKGLTSHIDFLGSLGGSFVDYPIPNMPLSGSSKFLVEASASINAKLLSDNYWVVPYVDLGVGASKYQSHYAAYTPLGVGLQVNLADEAFFTINTQYAVAITESAASHLIHSVTFYGVIGKKKR